MLFHLLLQAHSGVRYLVLLSGAVALSYCFAALISKRPSGRVDRVLGGVFVGTMDLQVVLGIAMILDTQFDPRLFGHLAPMILAVILAHLMLALNRRKKKPTVLFPLIGIGGALILIAVGIAALGVPMLGGGAPVALGG